MEIKLCGGIFSTEKEANRELKKWKTVAKNPKVEKSLTTSYWLLIVSEVNESRVEEAIHYFWGKGFLVFALKGMEK